MRFDDAIYMVYDTMLKYTNYRVEQTSRRITINYEDKSGQFDGRLDIEFDEDTRDVETISTSHNRKQHLIDAYRKQMAAENEKLGELK